MDNQDLLNKAYELFQNAHLNIEIDFLLSKKENKTNTKIIGYAHDKSDIEDLYFLSMNQVGEGQVQPSPEWDFNIDGDLFFHLQDGYDILYMPLFEHYGIWCNINE